MAAELPEPARPCRRRRARRAAPLLQRPRAPRALLVPLLGGARRGMRPALRGSTASTAAGSWRPSSGTRCTGCWRRSRSPRRRRRPVRSWMPPCARGIRRPPTTSRRRSRGTWRPGASPRSPAPCLLPARGPSGRRLRHDGVLLHGRLDVLCRTASGRSSSTTRPTRARREPEQVVEEEYRVQRMVYAPACSERERSRPRSPTSSSSAGRCRPRQFSPRTHRRSKRSCPPRSRGSDQASSGRPESVRLRRCPAWTSSRRPAPSGACSQGTGQRRVASLAALYDVHGNCPR